jgi:hypothetical protein
MIDPAAVQDILSQYDRHGWKLRRVLLTAPSREALAEVSHLFQGADILGSDLDGLWFSRSSQPGLTAWELRHLSSLPYALVEVFRDDQDPASVEMAISDVERRMSAAVQRRVSSPQP